MLKLSIFQSDAILYHAAPERVKGFSCGKNLKIDPYLDIVIQKFVIAEHVYSIRLFILNLLHILFILVFNREIYPTKFYV